MEKEKKSVKEELFLGIDVGTTSIKFGLVLASELIWETNEPLTTYSEDNGVRFQLKEDIIAIVCTGILKIERSLRQKIQTIGFSTAMHSCFPYSEESDKRIYIWSDFQAKDTVENFKKTKEAEHFYLKTGTPIHAMTPFSKILYMIQQKIVSEKTLWYGLKELILNAFTGEYLIDFSTASATGLMNLEKKIWDSEILAYLGIKENQLAHLVDTTDLFNISPEMAEKIGVSPTVDIMAGASDGCLAMYAGYRLTGINSSLTIGTSAALRQIKNEIVLDYKRQNFCYYLKEGEYVIGAPSNNGGNILAWASEMFFANQADFYRKLSTILLESCPGAKGLRFHPYLYGERAPFWDMNKKGGFNYLSHEHSKNDMIRGVLEGLLMNIRLLKEMVAPFSQLSISGGFFNNLSLQQMTADVLGVDCEWSNSNEPLFGLYVLAFPEKNYLEEAQLNWISPKSEVAAYYETISEKYFE